MANYDLLILKAITLKNFKLLKEIISTVGIDYRFENGDTILMSVINNRKYQIINFLIDAGVSINAKNNRNDNCLISAISQLNFDVVNLLIDKGCDVNEACGEGDTPLMYAIHCREFDIVKLLIEKGSNINVSNNYGISVLTTSIIFETFNVTELLIKKGVDINSRDNFGDTSLTQAIRRIKNNEKYFVIVKLLIENGADINNVDNSGYSILSTALIENNIDVCKILLQHGVLTKNVKCDPSTILNFIRLNNFQMIELLCELGVNLNVADFSNETPLKLAIRMNNFNIIKLLINFGANVNDTSILMHAQNCCMTQFLIDNGFRINTCDKNGNNALILSLIHDKNFNFVKLLVVNGINTDVKNALGKSPLMIALEKNRLNVIGFLIRYKRAVKIINNFMLKIIYNPSSSYVLNTIKTRFEFYKTFLNSGSLSVSDCTN